MATPIQRAVMSTLDRLRRELIRAGVIVEARISRETGDEGTDGYWSFIARFPPDGRERWRWILTDSEVEMTQGAVLEEWCGRIRAEAGRIPSQLVEQAAPATLQPLTPDLQAEAYARNARRQMELTTAHFAELIRLLRPYHTPGAGRGHARARELFIRTAGMDAYQVLNNGGMLPVTGSLGTAYVMTKRASFCLRNAHTQVEYCAVVPGVPLWDHLLGVKLMVEHDEPRLLATANTSIGRGAFGYVNNPRNFNAQG
jgi:hypothetical protein